MRKGYRREAGSEGSAKQRCEPMDKNRIGGASAGRAGNVSRSPYPSTARSVDPAAVHRRRLSLPREICRVSPLRRLRRPRGRLIARQKSAEGVVGQAVGKAPWTSARNVCGRAALRPAASRSATRHSSRTCGWPTGRSAHRNNQASGPRTTALRAPLRSLAPSHSFGRRRPRTAIARSPYGDLS